MGAGRREISREISNCLGERGAGRQSPGLRGWLEKVSWAEVRVCPGFFRRSRRFASSLH